MASVSSFGPFNTAGLSVGAVVAIGVVSLVFGVVYFIAGIRIISRAGYSGWWILALFVPILNIVMLLLFAFKEWPVQQELRAMRAWADQVQHAGGGARAPYGPVPGYSQY